MRSCPSGRTAVLIQPESGGHISGGYLYNEQMALHGAWTLEVCRAAELGAIVPTLRSDVVLADSLFLTPSLIGPFLDLRRRGVRVGVLLHALPSRLAAAGSGRAPEQATRFELETLEALGLVVLPGPYYHRLLGPRRFTTVLCEPGIEDAWRVPPRTREGPCRLVSVGAVTPLKGFADVLDALEGCAPETWQWTVVGSLDASRPYAAALRERAAQRAGVALVGQRSPLEARAAVRRADLLVMPSYEENHPLVALEAMASSVPVIAYAAAGTAGIVEHGRTGLLAPVGDKAELGRCLAALIADEARRSQLARACWQRQRDVPSWATAAGRAREALEALPV